MLLRGRRLFRGGVSISWGVCLEQLVKKGVWKQKGRKRGRGWVQSKDFCSKSIKAVT